MCAVIPGTWEAERTATPGGDWCSGSVLLTGAGMCFRQRRSDCTGEQEARCALRPSPALGWAPTAHTQLGTPSYHGHFPTDPGDWLFLVCRWTWTLPKHLNSMGLPGSFLTSASKISKVPQLLHKLMSPDWHRSSPRWDIVRLCDYVIEQREGKERSKKPQKMIIVKMIAGNENTWFYFFTQ